MRHALRTALAAAVVAGVALTPVVTATTALAAPASSAAESGATGDRYDGLKVSLAPGYLAVLRNHTADGGGEAWIRAVGPDWKPSDGYAGRVLTVLDRNRTSATVDGLTLRLVGATAEIPTLDVTGAAGTRTVMFPERVDDGVPVLRTVELKGGLTAKVYRRGDQHPYYTATVLKGAEELGELKAGAGYPAEDTKLFGRVRVTLDGSGDVTSALGAGKDLGKRRLADGTYGELWKKGEGWYELELDRDGYHSTIAVGGRAGGSTVGDQVDSMWVGVNTSGTVRSWINTAAGFGHGVIQGTQGCMVVRGSETPFRGVKVRLTNGPLGPKADLINSSDKSMTPFETLSLKNRTGLDKGARITQLASGRTVFQMRVGGAPTPWQSVDIPKAPTGKNCKGAAGTTATPGKGTGGATAQTAATGVQIVPKGAVAAGAEVEGGKGGNTALVAGGAGLASVGVAGLGFAALRRRAGARR
ncbi:hypothetical protein [Streptomyces sp. TLI_146]|uniref:hypothetical protein n=1 Tax=Streptomyces sp. TLI_146 TaxID=1938858 RepID=UPI000C6FEBCB|nr:hypothetical protein [Streptomyces sp. TLI_146]PKV87478.1 hypothetical protein BX283_5077 [Streptomyces sp. TLI_146]